jgi:hypothetical protein
MSFLAKILMLILLVIPAVGLSQNTPPQTFVDFCTGATVSGPVTLTAFDLTPGKAISCSSPRGRNFKLSSKGVAGWQYCRQPDGRYLVQFVVSPWSDFEQAPLMAKDLLQAGMSATPVTVDSLLRKYHSSPMTEPAHKALYCEARAQIRAEWPQDEVVSEWVTVSTITYNYRSGSLAGVAGTVALNVPCNCVVPFVVGSTTYCPLRGASNATVVARCKKP